MAKIRISEFSGKNNFCPRVNETWLGRCKPRLWRPQAATKHTSQSSLAQNFFKTLNILKYYTIWVLPIPNPYNLPFGALQHGDALSVVILLLSVYRMTPKSQVAQGDYIQYPTGWWPCWSSSCSPSPSPPCSPSTPRTSSATAWRASSAGPAAVLKLTRDLTEEKAYLPF